LLQADQSYVSQLTFIKQQRWHIITRVLKIFNLADEERKMVENPSVKTVSTVKTIPGVEVLSSLAPYAHWTLRIAIAAVFLYHGLTKFPALNGMAAMMGLPVAVLTLVALAETAAGALTLIGGFINNAIGDLLTRLGGAAVLPPMLGAIAMVHWGQWTFVASETHPMGGMEFQFTLVMIAVYLLLMGNNIKHRVS
jgi:putative oxidoreductase